MNRIIPKTILIFVSFVLFDGTLINAQAITKSARIISVGYGFAPIILNDEHSFLRDNQAAHYSYSGPFYIKYEGGKEDITLGLCISYGHYEKDYPANSSSIPSNPVTPYDAYYIFSALFRLNFHFLKSQKFDLYTGAAFGFKTLNFTSLSFFPSNEETINTFTWDAELTVGLRYYFLPTAAVYVETGLAASLIQGGLSFKLK